VLITRKVCNYVISTVENGTYDLNGSFTSSPGYTTLNLNYPAECKPGTREWILKLKKYYGTFG